MDIEEYRRVYMAAEGIGNTPLRMEKRFRNFGKSILAFPKAFAKDKEERQMRKEMREMARKDIRDHGLTIESAALWLSGRPKVHNNTYEASKHAIQAGLSAGLSVNELGQTASSIAGTRRSNLYDGQDMENGIRFTLRGVSGIGKAIQLPSTLLHQAEDLVINRGILPEYLQMPGGSGIGQAVSRAAPMRSAPQKDQER